jgi:hypothetical protein
MKCKGLDFYLPFGPLFTDIQNFSSDIDSNGTPHRNNYSHKQNKHIRSFILLSLNKY